VAQEEGNLLAVSISGNVNLFISDLASIKMPGRFFVFENE